MAFILMSTLIIGCKNENKGNQASPTVTEVKDNIFKITIESIIKKDDDYSLYYTDASGPEFKETLWSGVKGSETPQKTTFIIPNENVPVEIRLDFGLKKDQEDIVLKSVQLEYNGKKRDIVGAELGIYFRADDNKCTFDPTTGIIKAIVKNGERQSPSLYPQDKVLKAEIEKVIQ